MRVITALKDMVVTGNCIQRTNGAGHWLNLIYFVSMIPTVIAASKGALTTKWELYRFIFGHFLPILTSGWKIPQAELWRYLQKWMPALNNYCTDIYTCTNAHHQDIHLTTYLCGIPRALVQRLKQIRCSTRRCPIDPEIGHRAVWFDGYCITRRVNCTGWSWTFLAMHCSRSKISHMRILLIALVLGHNDVIKH